MSSRKTTCLVRAAAIAALLILALSIASTGPTAARAAQDPPAALLVTWQTADGSTFRAVVTDPVSIARVQAAFPGDGQAGIPAGQLAPGDGGVNAPHAWHMTNLEVVDATIELCDGTAAMVDADLDYWLNTVGFYCPWSAIVIAVEPFGDGGEPTAEPTVEPTAAPTEPALCPGDPSTAPDGPQVVTLDVLGESFRAVLTGQRDIALAIEELETGCDAGVITGDLAAGDGGVNAPHLWHLTNATYVDATIELCDGLPSHVDADLDEWLTNVKTYCPWSAVVVAVEPFAGGNPTPAPTPPPLTDPTPQPEPTQSVGGPTTLPSTGSGTAGSGGGYLTASFLAVASLVVLTVLRMHRRQAVRSAVQSHDTIRSTAPTRRR